MWRGAGVLTGTGLGLGVLAAIGWHFQPAWSWAEPVPRALTQRVSPALLAARGPAGAVSDDELWDWSPFWPPAAVALPLAGALLGLVLALVLRGARRRLDRVAEPVAPRSGPLTPLGGLGLATGALAAVAWHVEPTLASWAGGGFLPADVGYPAVGLLLGVTLGVALARAGWRVVGTERSG